jgi:hypothetical protein
MAFSNYPTYVVTPEQKAIHVKSILDQGGNESDAAYRARVAAASGGYNLAGVYNSLVAGGGGDNMNGINTVDGTSGVPVYPSNTGGGSGSGSEDQYQDDINNKIDEYYGQAMGRLDSQRSDLKGSEQDYYNIATSPYDQQVPLINQAAQQGQGTITEQRGQAGTQEQNALAAARRLYDELTSRNRQAFGSGALGSVGQAAGEVLGRSAQQQFGTIRNTAGETQQSLMTAARNLEQQTQAQLQSLELQKGQALSQAKLWFKERLDAINALREETSLAKSQAKLDALKEYRDYARTLESQASDLRNQLTLSAATQYNGLTNNTNQFATGAGQYGSYAQGVTGNQANTNAGAQAKFQLGNNLSAASPQSTLDAQGLYGSYAPSSSKPLKDIYGNPLL